MDSSNEFLVELGPVLEELAVWRNNPERVGRIPGAVWDQATVLAKKYGVQAVSKALNLGYRDLKQRVFGAGGRSVPVAGIMPAFIEVKPASVPDEAGCVIELTKGSGTRMRISLKSASAVDWCRIKEAFLGA